MTDTLGALICVVIAGLLGYRLARLIAVDAITEPLRNRMARWAYPKTLIAHTDSPPEPAPRHKGREFLFDLVSCIHCVGVWVTVPASLVISSQLINASILVHLAIAVAAAGLESYLASRS